MIVDLDSGNRVIDIDSGNQNPEDAQAPFSKPVGMSGFLQAPHHDDPIAIHDEFSDEEADA